MTHRSGRSAAVAAFIAALLAAFPAPGRTISGRVVDEQGQPRGGVRLQVEDLLAALESCCGPIATTTTTAGGSFTFDVPSSVYVVATEPNPSFNPVRVRVDVRAGNARDLVLRAVAGPFAFSPDDPPRANLIEIGEADRAGMASINGKPGAVGANDYVLFATLETGHVSAVQAGGDGSFSATHFAPRSSSVMIKSDPAGTLMRRVLWELAFEGEGSLAPMTGTIVRAPDPPAASQGIAFASSGIAHDQRPPVWWFEGTINKDRFVSGDSLLVSGTMRIESSSLPAEGRIAVTVAAGFDPLARADGSPALANGMFASTIALPTGLPLEYGSQRILPFFFARTVDFIRTGPTTAEAAVEMSIAIPAELPAGWYRPSLWLNLDGPEASVPLENPPRPLMVCDRVDGKKPDQAFLPIIRIGEPQPPRLLWTLLTDDLSNGSRGTIALEDRGRFATASRIVTDSETFIIPRVDRRSGLPNRYRLEPFAPTISLGDRGTPPAPPMVPFRFPGGSLRVTIQRPNGAVETIGPAPFVQPRVRTLVDARGNALDFGGGNLTDVYQLSTMDPRFEVSFAEDGEHRVTLDGWIEDTQGNRWLGRGTYEFVVADVLSIDSATIPGTPFEVGDTLVPALAIAPPIAAEVELRVTQVPRSETARRQVRTIRGHTNRFGYFSSVERIRFDEAGEYRADVHVEGKDGAGDLWAGSRTWGGVVAPRNSPIVAHGKRGIEAQPEPRQAWYVHAEATQPRSVGLEHMFSAFHGGDVQWAQKIGAVLPILTFQDSQGRMLPLLRNRSRGENMDALQTLGELPLYSTRLDGHAPYIDPEAVDHWGYAYTAVERPLVRVREQNHEGVLSLYWRFSARYARQYGVGANGDLPNDFKFQFGGAVLRGAAVGEPLYAIYGSLFVLVPDDDPRGGNRVFPAFQGNGGGPSGGPLFRLGNRDIELFFHPTAVRPGTILQRGAIASFAGYSAPTLPSKIEIVVTSPSGRARTISGQANLIGYFHDPAHDFVVDEAGVWKARVRILFDGRTSAGQVSAPYPAGDVLGSREGEFYFYVVDSTAPSLTVSRVDGGGSSGGIGARPFVRPADGPITFTIAPPEGWSSARLTYTTTMPGFVLEEGTTTSSRYTYDAPRLARDFPNLDLLDADGYAGADTITISFLLSGTDASGESSHVARQVVIQGEELLMPEQNPRPKRRSVR